MTESLVKEERRLDRDVLMLTGKVILQEEEQQLTREARQAFLNLSSKTSMKEVLSDLIVQSMIESLHRNMPEAIIYGAIQKLDSFLVEEPNYDTHDERIVKEVVSELRIMQGFLRDKESGERTKLKYLLLDFAELAQVSADHTTKYEIAEALDWLRKAKKRMMQYGVNEGVSRAIPNEGPNLKTSCIKGIDDFFYGYGVKNSLYCPLSVGEGEEGVVVGLEKDVHQLIGRAILNENSGLVTSCIKGMLGVGKTTLARQVYNHPAINEKFMRRAWVCISSDTSIHEVLMELIHQLVELDVDSLLVEDMDNRSLQQMLHQHLQGWPYFIVLDNLLPDMRLESILIALRQEGHGSRLLLTSRHEIKTSNLYYTHEMKTLDSDKSWQLFLKAIFYGDKFSSDEHNFPKHLERKGREMLKQCGGLPVAIIDVARQKAKQRLAGIEWEELFDSIDLSESLKLLEPMYHNLDEELKPWFLHMPFFKENAIIREGKLVQIRIASRSTTEWKIEGNISDLVSQSIVEAANRGGKYRLNPLLHKLSIKKAEEEIGFEILRSDGNNRPSHNPRHRVIHCGREKFNHSTNQDGKHLISLIFHGGGAYLDDTSPSYWESFELLKILDIEDFGVKTLSEKISTLTELRYLGLRNNYLTKIPHSLGDLEILEVLDIALNFMVEVPDIIWKMRSLRHLYMSDVICPEPLKIDVLDLHSLIYVSIYDWTCEVARLETMTRLRKLGIEEIDDISDVSKLFASLSKLRYLFHLFLRGFRFRSMSCLDEIGVLKKLRKIKLDGLLSRLPSADDFPQLVNDLILVNTCLDEDPMPVLEKLPQLWRLKLRNAYTGREMAIQCSGFPELEVLRINELWNVRKVEIGEGAMRDLKKLEIKNCPHLKTLSDEIGSMKCLNKFEMVTTKHIATEIRKSGLLAKIVEVNISP